MLVDIRCFVWGGEGTRHVFGASRAGAYNFGCKYFTVFLLLFPNGLAAAGPAKRRVKRQQFYFTLAS